MIHKIDQLITLLKQLNTKLGTDIITPEDIVEAENQLLDLKQDLQKLTKAITDPHNIATTEETNKTMAHLYQYLGDIIQDLENIHEIVTSSVKRYSAYLDKSNK